ncbi:hypothetical protein REPUB_Repub14bG0115300 [Reevesia pubescens]
MASFSALCLSKQQLISSLFINTIFSGVSGWECYKSIISFGDSLADTGNLVILSQPIKPPSAFPPYGRTYFNRPTAQKFGLPLVPPYLEAGNGSNRKIFKGVNFAVAGATALDNAFLAQKGIFNRATDVSLEVQELIKLGAVAFLVPGNLPIGCQPIYLTRFQTSNKQDYDQSGCLIWLNEFSKYYNGMLKKELNKIRRLHPCANIVYADYYQATIPFYRSPIRFGTFVVFNLT